MYLYVFEDGSMKQSQLPPTAEDTQCIEDGILQVLTLVGAKFVEARVRGGVVSFEDVPEVNQSEGYSH